MGWGGGPFVGIFPRVQSLDTSLEPWLVEGNELELGKRGTGRRGTCSSRMPYPPQLCP